MGEWRSLEYVLRFGGQHMENPPERRETGRICRKSCLGASTGVLVTDN